MVPIRVILLDKIRGRLVVPNIFTSLLITQVNVTEILCDILNYEIMSGICSLPLRVINNAILKHKLLLPDTNMMSYINYLLRNDLLNSEIVKYQHKRKYISG